MDNTISATIYIHRKGDLYREGDTITVGTNGKLSAEYFWPTGCAVYADFLEFDGTFRTSYCFLAAGNYHEDHWYWRVAESYAWSCNPYSDLLYFALK